MDVSKKRSLHESPYFNVRLSTDLEENKNLDKNEVAKNKTKKSKVYCFIFLFACIPVILVVTLYFFPFNQNQLSKQEKTVKEKVITDCNDVLSSGVYNMSMTGMNTSLLVYCDLKADGGKWLVFQRRRDGSVDFYRDWIDYKYGFGNVQNEFWLGLEYLHLLTIAKSYELRVDLTDWDGNTSYATYKYFTIGSEASNYSLSVRLYHGTAGDSLLIHNDQQFSTRDRRNDKSQDNGGCAILYSGAWWYKRCYDSNLNGQYFKGGILTTKGVVWYSWKSSTYSVKEVEMKIRAN